MAVRQLFDHAANAVNEALKITVIDAPGAGGASHLYQVEVPNGKSLIINFQNGPITEFGVNGVTQEALLAIVMDRLRSFQKGSFSCRENALALTKVEEAMMWLHSRTAERVRRGVEGKTEK